MKIQVTEKQLKLILSKYNKEEIDEQDSASSTPSACTSSSVSKQGYPSV